jgi:hypothetical protein
MIWVYIAMNDASRKGRDHALHIDINTAVPCTLSQPQARRHMQWVFGIDMVGLRLGFCGEIGEVTEAA